jgi:hypothetical protein
VKKLGILRGTKQGPTSLFKGSFGCMPRVLDGSGITWIEGLFSW